MRLEIIRCDTCKKEQDAHQSLPPEWLTISRSGGLRFTGRLANAIAHLRDGSPVTNFKQPEMVFSGPKDQHFCSDECLRTYFQVAQPAKETQEDRPDCKARRFLLVDGETAEIVDGVKWGNGSVTIEGDAPAESEHFSDWNALKKRYDGSGVQWIDRETEQEETDKEPIYEHPRMIGESESGW